MNHTEHKTIDEFMAAFNGGQRQFLNWNFDANDSVQGMNLSGVEFQDCFLFTDWRNTNLANAKFIHCNLKTADFRGANLTNAIIKNCAVEGILFKGAKTENIQFEENYSYSEGTNLGDFEAIFLESNEE